MKLRGLRQQGDTIVEVLIAMAIVSLVLAGAYTSTNHAIATNQDAQEHAQALQLAQTQVERLRTGAASLTTAGTQCFLASGSPASVNTDCLVSADGQTHGGSGDLYTITISQQPDTTYQVQITWESLVNSTGSNVSLLYRPEV